MKIGLQGISPLVFSGLRSIFILPLLFFIPKPNVSWKFILLMGTLIGTIKLPLMLLAIHLGVAAGLSSILIQVQAFFTVLLALFFFKQKPTFFNWLGMAISFVGIGLIALQVGGEASFLGLLIILISALFWAISNLIIQKKGKNLDMLGLTAWMNLVPPIPLFVLSFFLYGEENFITSFANLNWNS
ncbi:MAG: DMT family transporter, partial [Alphaproteobacteria bacterium]